MRTLEQIMTRMGFAPSDTGPHVTELRKLVARQMSEGLVDRSYGSWAPGTHSAEERAQALLEVEWAIQQGLYHEVKNLDSGIRRPVSMVGDWCRELAFHFRRLRVKLSGKRNPYARS